MENKRGQVTLFVILGVVVLIIVGISVFLLGMKKEKIDDSIYDQNYDAKLAPIYNDVVFCIDLLSKQAVNEVGATGGYVSLNPIEYKYNRPAEYDNDALEIFPGSGIIVPYWLQIRESPQCTECSPEQSFPYLNGGEGQTIQNGIETYVEENLIGCLDNFSKYKADLDVNYDAKPVCNVEFRDENVFVGVTWPLKVTFADETTSQNLNAYSTILDVRLKKMYEYALSILYQTEMTEDERTFEYFMKDIISYYSFGGDEAPIPPVSGPTTFEFSAPKIWLQNNVETTLKQAAAENIPYMQVVGTKDSFIMVTNDSVKSNFYQNYQNVVYYDDDFASDVRVRFNYYPMWPMYVSVYPSSGPVIMPESSTINMWLIKLSTTRYNFYYDVSYPVLVTLEDDDAFGGEGYIFNYAFEANLRDNDAYSNESINMQAYMNNTGNAEDLGYEQRTVPVTINVIDGYTNLPKEGVTLTYTCLDKEYIVGTSKASANNPNALIESFLAPCIGGKFTMDEFGYAETPLYEDVILGTPIVFDYPVYSSKDLTLEFRKRLYGPTVVANPTKDHPEIDRQWALSGGEGYTSGLATDEKLIFMMSEIRSDGSMGNVVYYDSTAADKTVSLAPGKYSVELISTLEMGDNYSRKNITIPGRTMKVKGDDIQINDTVLEDSMYLGGISLGEENNNYVIISPSQLASKSYLVVYYPSYNPDELQYIEDLSVLEKIMAASVDYPQLFTPVME